MCLLAGCSNVIANGSRSKVVDLGRVIYSRDESTLLKKIQGFEGHTNVAVKIYTTFRLHKNYDVDIIYTKELSGDNTIAIVVQTGWLSTLTDDYEPSRYKDDLHIDRTENLNKENLLPSSMIEEIRKRMINKFYSAGNDEQSKNLYHSLNYGVELLASLIYNPVAVKGSLIWESLWNRADPYIMPEIAGFVDGCYNTYKAIPQTDEAVEGATEVARDFAFNYALNRDGYRDAVNDLVAEALTNLDTYIKLANGIVATEDKIVNIYKGTTPEDCYWRGIIVFEVASAVFPFSKTKTAAKSASGIRELLDDLKRFKIGKLIVKDLKAQIDDLISSTLSKSKKIAKFEDLIRKESIEHGMIIDDNGKIIAYKEGEADKISFGEFVSVAEGKTLTHNHPSNGTFSEWDFFAAYDLKLSEIRAVGPTKTYVMKRPQGGWPSREQIANASQAARTAWTEKYLAEYRIATNERKKILEQIYWDMARPDLMKKFNIMITE